VGYTPILYRINAAQDEQNSAAQAFLQHHGFWAKSDVWFMRAPIDLGRSEKYLSGMEV
jgi:hypothetical protein